MNIFSIFPILTVLFWSCPCVASPQSKSQTSAPNRRANAECCRVDEGWADAVPRNVTDKDEKAFRADMDVVRRTSGA